MRKVIVGVLAAVLVGIGAKVFIRPGSHARSLLRRRGDQLARRLRYWTGRWQGVSYRLAGRHPDPDVIDDVLRDRIRSSIGPLEKRLDLPGIRVVVDDHTARLHGVVTNQIQGNEIERAVAAVPGVRGVESFLHVGLRAGDTRPSEGRHPGPSAALRELRSAAIDAGITEEEADVVLRAALVTLGQRVPTAEWNQVNAHLPVDVRVLIDRPRTSGAPSSKIRTVPEFVAEVLDATGIDPALAEPVIEAIFGAVCRLVPEEVADVSAVLPPELRQLWHAPVTT